MKSTVRISPTESLAFEFIESTGCIEITFQSGFMSFTRSMTSEAARAMATSLDLCTEAAAIAEDRGRV